MPSRKLADLPLHSGAAPAWLFRRMVEMAGAIGSLIVRDQGPEELLRRLSDPFWFQAFGCVLGFDWHSSGVTTTVCGALKEAAKKYRSDLNLYVCGGKGATVRAGRMAAVDGTSMGPTRLNVPTMYRFRTHGQRALFSSA